MVENDKTRQEIAAEGLPLFVTYDNAGQLEELYDDINAPVVLVLCDQRGAVYLVGSNEDGELFYQGMPTSDGITDDPNRGFLSDRTDDGGPVFPVELIGAGSNI